MKADAPAESLPDPPPGTNGFDAALSRPGDAGARSPEPDREAERKGEPVVWSAAAASFDRVGESGAGADCNNAPPDTLAIAAAVWPEERAA